MNEEPLSSPLSDEEALLLAGQEAGATAMWMATIGFWAVAVQMHEASHVLQPGRPVYVRVKPWAELSLQTKVVVFNSFRTHVAPPVMSIAIQACGEDDQAGEG